MEDARAKEWFHEEVRRAGFDGIYGVASFNQVYQDLMDIQKTKLRSLCGDQFPQLKEQGVLVSIGIFHTRDAILSINHRREGKVDKERWNIYSKEYSDVNRLLDKMTQGVAQCIGGIPIQATLEGISNKVKHVSDYFPLVVSHRAVAVHAGLGWFGKNGLMVTKERGCAVRLASVIVPKELEYGQKMNPQCGDCKACLDACGYLKRKEELEDYREECRKQLNRLDLDHGGCGICLRACYERSVR